MAPYFTVWSLRKLARRREALSGVCNLAAVAPMFCVETGIKAFFWATLIYDYTDAAGQRFEKLPESVKVRLDFQGAGVNASAVWFVTSMLGVAFEPPRKASCHSVTVMTRMSLTTAVLS